MPNTEALFIMNDKDTNSGIDTYQRSKFEKNHENFREGSFAIPIDILEQKLLLHKGLVMVSQGEYDMT